MKKVIFSVIILLFFGISSASAFDWETKGIRVLESGGSDDENFILLEDSSSIQMRIRFRNELDEKWAAAAADLFRNFKSWNYMKMSRIEFFVTNNTMEIIVIPFQYSYKNTDFTPHIPGGMVFIYDDYLRYNFRVNKDNFFLRINDRFINEEILSMRIKEAIDDPVAYLTKRDPEYFLQKLTELEGEQQILKETQERLARSILYFQNTGFLGFGNTPVKNSVIRKIIEIKTADPSIKADAIKAKLSAEKIEASDKEIKLVLNVFYNEFD